MEFIMEIFLSKKKLILLLIGSVVFVTGGIWIIFNRLMIYDLLYIIFGIKGGAIPFLFYIISGFGGVIFFGLGIYVFIKKILSVKPGLIIDHSGITDAFSGLSAGHIAWDNIDAIKSFEIITEKMIVIVINNPEDYIAQQKSPASRKGLEINYKTCGSPILFTANIFEYKHDELLNILNEQLLKWKK
jgi:hypothetical protein